jgi:uncharacterized membrane protein YhaH (DUF805 family)
MLGFLFGLNSRLGRLHFFLSLIGLGFVTTVVLFVLTGRVPQSDQMRGDIAFALAQGPVIIALIVFAVAGLQLLCMRIRDIGWDPVMVMSGWFATLLVDKLIATKLPTLALTPEHFGTVIGALASLALALALMFWSTGDAEDPELSAGEPWEQSDTPRRGRSTPATTDRISRISNGRTG